MLREGLPDVSFSIDEIIAEGDKVAVLATGRGTHNGNFIASITLVREAHHS